MKLSEFSKDQLQWILTVACAEILDINFYIESVQKNGMVSLLEDEVDKRRLHRAELVEIVTQVKKAIGDIAIREVTNSN